MVCFWAQMSVCFWKWTGVINWKSCVAMVTTDTTTWVVFKKAKPLQNVAFCFLFWIWHGCDSGPLYQKVQTLSEGLEIIGKAHNWTWGVFPLCCWRHTQPWNQTTGQNWTVACRDMFCPNLFIFHPILLCRRTGSITYWQDTWSHPCCWAGTNYVVLLFLSAVKNYLRGTLDKLLSVTVCISKCALLNVQHIITETSFSLTQ